MTSLQEAVRVRKIRVLFVLSDSAKWKQESLVKRLASDPRFEVLGAVTLFGWADDRERAEKRAEETERYFRGRFDELYMAYDFENHRPFPLSKFSPDVVFYDQPWDLFPSHCPNVVSCYALTCYVPYMVPSYTIHRIDCMLPFHRMLFRHFILNDSWMELCKAMRGRVSSAGVFVSSGHTMFDTMAESHVQDPGRVIIYAPHWSFPHRDNPNELNISTFLWTKDLILAYAKRHPEQEWAFKPHPVLKGALIKAGVMTASEVDEYYAAWEQIGECCYTGDYPDLFRRSCVLLTDCASFLTEYACTGKPIVRLVSPEAKIHPCELSENLYSTYYQVRTPEELEPMLDKIVVRGEDPNREARLAAAKEMNLMDTDAAGNIVRHLECLFRS